MSERCDGGAPLLSVDGLKVSFATEEGVVRAVDGVSFTVDPGEVVAIVGESGSGKSVTAMTLMGLTRGPNAQFEGTATFDQTELIAASGKQLQGIRGAGIAMVFQDPMSSLDPVYRVGVQIVEQIRAHDEGLQGAGDGPRGRDDGAGRYSAREGADAVLSAPVLGRHAPARDDRDGALVLAQAPDRRRADDRTGRDDPGPDPGGDARSARADDAGIILVTHDLGVVADIADRMMVMYSGRVVEQGTLDELFYNPQHPYTWGLLGSITRVDADRTAAAAIPGMPPSVLRAPTGCHFRPRCPHAFDKCGEVPELSSACPTSPASLDRCFLEVGQTQAPACAETATRRSA